jgi:hypothetical protein
VASCAKAVAQRLLQAVDLVGALHEPRGRERLRARGDGGAGEATTERSLARGRQRRVVEPDPPTPHAEPREGDRQGLVRACRRLGHQRPERGVASLVVEAPVADDVVGLGAGVEYRQRVHRRHYQRRAARRDHRVDLRRRVHGAREAPETGDVGDVRGRRRHQRVEPAALERSRQPLGLVRIHR